VLSIAHFLAVNVFLHFGHTCGFAFACRFTAITCPQCVHLILAIPASAAAIAIGFAILTSYLDQHDKAEQSEKYRRQNRDGMTLPPRLVVFTGHDSLLTSPAARSNG
jgi:hypothetical protein